MTRVTLMAGGVGGAKLAEGLAEIPEMGVGAFRKAPSNRGPDHYLTRIT